jgi:hypothetical protein
MARAGAAVAAALWLGRPGGGGTGASSATRGRGGNDANGVQATQATTCSRSLGRVPGQLLAGRKGGPPLIISVSAVLLFGVAVAAMVRWAGLKAWHALVCVLAGFYLASSSLAPQIGRVVAAVARALTGHG